MSRSSVAALAGFLALAAAAPARAQGTKAQDARPREVSTQEAEQYKGRQATVCGTVATVRFTVRVGGAPTFINFDKPNPDQTFTVLIWGLDRPKFAAPPESTFTAGKRVCATGLITDFKGKPEIIVHGPTEIRVETGGR